MKTFLSQNGIKQRLAPALPKFAPLHLYESPTLVPVFASQEKSKEEFHYYKKAVIVLMQAFHKSETFHKSL